MITVAIATENDFYDGELYRTLVEMIIKKPAQAWKTDLRFSGWKSIADQGPLFLVKAQQQDIVHAIFAIDNDGGATRAPEHQAAHVSAQQAKDEKAGCRYCWLVEKVPKWWAGKGNKLCLAVPVQTLETWLLYLRGDAMLPSPEQIYDRKKLKELFFGKPFPPTEKRTALALEQLQKPEALTKLRDLRSFKQFEAHLASW
jgi:hypothetical protein